MKKWDFYEQSLKSMDSMQLRQTMSLKLNPTSIFFKEQLDKVINSINKTSHRRIIIHDLPPQMLLLLKVLFFNIMFKYHLQFKKNWIIKIDMKIQEIKYENSYQSHLQFKNIE